MSIQISVLSVFPDLYKPFLETSLIKKASESGLVNIDVNGLFEFSMPKKRIDAPSFGPGSGMLIKPETVELAIEHKEKMHGHSSFKIFFSPHGQKMTKHTMAFVAQKALERKHVMLLPARYEGMDARVEEHYADLVLSVGDFVLMGGDIPALMLMEGFLRFIPGVVGKQESVEHDSFSGPFVDYPEYTEPVEWMGKKVPEIIRSGNHAAIAHWRLQQSAHRTAVGHFDWFRAQHVTGKEKADISAEIPSHYVALMHGDVLVGKNEHKQPGATSVTSIDIHDIARSSRTYGLKQFFIVTPLLDQERIVKKLLNFWQIGEGVTYNANRHEAVSRVLVKNKIDEVIEMIEKEHGVPPLIIATSARHEHHEKTITYHDQQRVWHHDRPVLFLLGTGQGLTESIIQRCDFLLVPVEGLSDFNHLSVRSAAAIIFDRWLGLNPQKP